MATATELLAAACTSGLSCLNELDLLRIIAQGASTGGGGGGGGGGTLSTDGTFAANSDLLYPSQKAAKTYVDTSVAEALVTASGLYVLKAGDTMTGALLQPAGSVGAPALSRSGDTDTGIWYPAANTWAISTAGAERLRIDSAGLVGIGTVSPNKLLSVSASDPQIQFQSSNMTVASSASFGALTWYSADASSNSTGVLAQIDAVANRNFDGDQGATGMDFRILTANLTNKNNPTERVRVTYDGNVGIGIVAPLARLHITPSASGTDYFRIDHSDGTPRLQVGALTGSVTLGAIWFGDIVPSATNYGLASDGGALRVGSSLAIPSGSNQRAGNATLVGGTLTVLNTTVTANTLVFLTRKTTGGTIGFAVTYTVIAATSFTITSDNALDTSTYSYLLVENP